MQLTEAFNGGAHGNIHGVVGGTWSAEAEAFAAVTPDIVLPFIHHVYVSDGGDICGCRPRFLYHPFGCSETSESVRRLG